MLITADLRNFNNAAQVPENMARSLISILFGLFFLSYHVSTSPVPSRRVARSPTGVVHMPLSKRGSLKLARRQSVATSITNGHEDAQLDNTEGYYYVTVEVGTPSQSLDLLVDTGSSDTWVYGSQYDGVTNRCGAENEFCKSSGLPL